jgi:hypothetical protein
MNINLDTATKPNLDAKALDRPSRSPKLGFGLVVEKSFFKQATIFPFPTLALIDIMTTLTSFFLPAPHFSKFKTYVRYD